MNGELGNDFVITQDDLVMKGKICMSNVDDLKKAIMEEAYCSSYVMHPDSTKMYRTIKKNFWWSGIKRDIVEFVSRYLMCYFFISLSRTQTCHDAIWVIMDKLIKSTHFLVIRSTFSLDRLARLYIDEIIKLHGVLMTIVSDRDPRFTFRFWL